MRLFGMLVVVFLSVIGAPLRAQEPLRVMSINPDSNAPPGTIITVSFNKPVAITPRATIAARTLVTIAPAIEARFEWRDPATIVIVPKSLLKVGTTYVVSVGTMRVNAIGQHLATSYSQTFRVRGPHYLGTDPRTTLQGRPSLTYPGVMSMLVDTPVDSATLRYALHIDASEKCTAQDIPYRVVSVREPDKKNPYNDYYKYTNNWSGQNAQERTLYRIIDIAPNSPPPEGCNGDIELSPLSAGDMQPLRYQVATAEPFTARFGCLYATLCAQPNALNFVITSSVAPDTLARYVRLVGDGKIQLDELPARYDARRQLIPASLKFRTPYRFAIDSALRDIWGRPVRNPRTIEFELPDVQANLGYATNFVYAARDASATLALRHINADSVDMIMSPLTPEYVRRLLLDGTRDSYRTALSAGTSSRTVAVGGPLNEDRISNMQIGFGSTRRAGADHAMALRFRLRSIPTLEQLFVDSIGVARNAFSSKILDWWKAKWEGAELAAWTQDTVPSPIVVVQSTNLVVYAKTGGSPVTAFVVDRTTGMAVTRAAVRWLDGAGNVVVADSTNAFGVATAATPNFGASRNNCASDDSVALAAIVREHPERGRICFIDVSTVDDHLVIRSALEGGMSPQLFEEALEASARARMGRAVESVRADQAVRGSEDDNDEEYLDIEPDRDERGKRVFGMQRVMLYSERGIYRPGEKVFVGAIMRQGMAHMLTAPPVGDSMRVEVHGSGRDDIADTLMLRLSAFGTASDSLTLSPRAALGTYRLVASIVREGRWQSVAQASFKVAEYRAPEFLVTLAADTVPVTVGDSAKFALAATFLFGGPMSGAIVQWDASLGRQATLSEIVKGLPEGFSIGPKGPATDWDERGGARGSTTLTSRGDATITVATKTFSTSIPRMLDVTAIVEDVNRQTVSAGASGVLHTSSFYLAVRDSSDGIVSANVPMRADLMVVTPRGDRLSGRTVRYALVQWQWRAKAAVAGANKTYAWVADTVFRDSLVSTAGAQPIHVTPKGGGLFELALVSHDDNNRVVTSSVMLWSVANVVPSPLATNAASSELSNEAPSNVVALSADRIVNRIGDTAVVHFTSPFAHAEAWITAEREGLLWQARISVVAGNQSVRIPIDSTFAPNVVIGVLLVPTRPTADGAPLYDRMRVGYMNLEVAASRRRLRVTVRSPGAHLPQDSATITVRVRDIGGLPARGSATVWAVDEGVLSMSDWKAPDPTQYFMAPGIHALSDVMTTWFDATQPAPLFHFGPMLMHAAGSAVGVSVAQMPFSVGRGDAPLRALFRSVAFYHANVALDSNGEAQFKQKLPDNVTTYRLIAVVSGAGDQSGVGESSMLVTKPLIVRASLPRFVRAGDSVFAGGVVNVRETVGVQPNASQSIAVTASGTLMSVRGASTQTAQTKVTGTEVRFPWKVSEGDSATVTLTAARNVVDRGKPAVQIDAVRTVLAVRPTGRPRVQSTAGVVRSQQVVRIALPPGTDPARSTIAIHIAASPLGTFALARKFFDSYPYDCTEQLSSKLRVLLAQLAVERAGLLPRTDTTETFAKAQKVVDELVRRRMDDGGISYWRDGGMSPTWVTAYAGIALLEAKDVGLAFSPDWFDKTTELISRALNAPVARDTVHGTVAERRADYAQRHSTELVYAWYLRSADQPNVAIEKQLLERVDELTWEDRAWFAELLHRAGQDAVATTVLNKLLADVKPAGAMADLPPAPGPFGFYSRTRIMARLVSATVRIAPEHVLLGPLVERMLKRGGAAKSWEWNTHDYGWMMPALAEYVKTFSSADARVTVSAVMSHVARARSGTNAATSFVLNASNNTSRDSSLSLAVFAHETRNASDSVVAELSLRTSGSPAFYAITVDGVGKTRPVTPDRNGLLVERWYERYSDGKPVTELVEGELVRVRLRVTAPTDRDYVAVEDPLPAGLEAVDLSLKTSASVGPYANAKSDAAGQRSAQETANGAQTFGGGVYENGWWTPWEHRELRDDRVQWFATRLWQGSHTMAYLARATTSGKFVRPPAVAEEMYNAGVNGRSEGGWFTVTTMR